jgi:hypothetical protein
MRVERASIVVAAQLGVKPFRGASVLVLHVDGRRCLVGRGLTYGDAYPTTSEGRLIAVLLMAAGVGVFGTLSGLAASWFLSPAAEEADTDLTEIKSTLTEIQRQIERLGAKSTR